VEPAAGCGAVEVAIGGLDEPARVAAIPAVEGMQHLQAPLARHPEDAALIVFAAARSHAVEHPVRALAQAGPRPGAIPPPRTRGMQDAELAAKRQAVDGADAELAPAGHAVEITILALDHAPGHVQAIATSEVVEHRELTIGRDPVHGAC